MYYVYVLVEKESRKTYIGYTDNLSTKAGDYELVYYEAYLFKKDAQRREQKLKQRGSSKQLLIKRIEGSIKEMCT